MTGGRAQHDLGRLKHRAPVLARVDEPQQLRMEAIIAAEGVHRAREVGERLQIVGLDEQTCGGEGGK